MSGKHSVQKTSKNSPSPSNAAGNFPSASMEYYASNFPHPEHLERYEVLFPGAAEIVFTEFRKQAEHRQELEKLVVPQQMRNARTGIYVQAISHICSACATVLTALYTPWWTPVLLAAIYSATTVAIYVHGKNKQSRSIDQKQ